MSLEAPILYHSLDTVDSTNMWVRRHYAGFDLTRLHLVHAAEQTQGKGTHGKSWVSPKDLNLYATFFFALPERGSYTTLAQLLSLSVAYVLQEKGINPAIKWPNDLMLDHKKIGGILCELVPLQNRLLVILGFGLNVNMPLSLCETIDQPATSLLAATHHPLALTPLLHEIGEHFQKDLLIYLREGFEPFVSAYEHFMIYRNYPVLVQGNIVGTSEGITPQGELLVLSPDGHMLTITSGSIQL